MSRKIIDLTGREFGTLKVVCQGHRDDGENRGHTYWVVECLCCHTIKLVRADNLLSGKVVSCGRCGKLKDKNKAIFDENMENDLGVMSDFGENDLGV